MLSNTGASLTMSFRGWRLLRSFLALFLIIIMMSPVSCHEVTLKESHPSSVHRSSEVLESLETHLLQMLGMKRRPHSNRESPTVPPFMMKLFRRQTSEPAVHFALKNRHTSTANTVRSYTHVDSTFDTQPSINRFFFRFNISNLPESEEITAAELRLFHAGNDTVGNDAIQRLMVYDVLRPVVDDEPHTRLLDTRVLHPRRTRWERLDVSPAVHRWHKNSKTNHGLLVQVVAVNGETQASQQRVYLNRISNIEDKTWHEVEPVLFLFTDDGRESTSARTRSRRSPVERKGHRRKHRENCRRHSLYVDFSDVGWNDWIVAPPGYEAFYCHGNCPFPLADHLNTTNHAIVQTLVNSVNPKAVPRACCVPTELSPISMLYLDEYDKVVLKNYQDMVVEGCGCR